MTAARRELLSFSLRYAAAWSPLALLGLVGLTVSGRLTPVSATQVVLTATCAALFALPIWTLTRAVESWSRWMGASALLGAGVGWAVAYAVTARLIQSLLPAGPAQPTMPLGPLQFVAFFFLYLVALTAMLGARAYARAERTTAAAAASEQAREQAESLRVRAELEALRAHLDPHFLFNTLNAIAAVIDSDPAAARQMLVRAATLLRRVLDLGESGRDTVTLAEEWEMVSEYLAFERLRMGERLRVDAAFSDDALDCEIPAFTLQPLVENAIRHGLFPRPGAGELHLRGDVKGETLLLEVRDDGVGAELSSVTNAKGFGVRATRERAKGLYGEAARVEIDTAPGRGFSVRLTVPLRPPVRPLSTVTNGRH